MLIQGQGEALRKIRADTKPADIYRAACRVAMRLVVILFAESRDLLPRDNALYHESYGLNGLIDQLERSASADRFCAWPRVLSLFRLVRDGSHHPQFPVTAYGGALFAQGSSDSEDGVARALAVFEEECFADTALSDRDVHAMLRLLTRTTTRIRQGKSSARVTVPVDFSDLSSEYIGILYEGLLDYELKTAPPDDPVIFLAVGDQPALPLSRLEAMDRKALQSLFEGLKKKTDDTQPDEDPEESAEDECIEASTTDGDSESYGPEQSNNLEESDVRRQSQDRARTWARTAAREARLVPKPRGEASPGTTRAFENKLDEMAARLVGRIALPDEWYLVRWGGTRKGSGSFYTRPGLAVPTVQRTLHPLAYDPPLGEGGKPDRDAPAPQWTPKLPEQILALTVCDPACGSGTFPLAALRFLTDALFLSLQCHNRIHRHGEQALVHLFGADAEPDRNPDSSTSNLSGEVIPCPITDDTFEERLKVVLRRHLVERCIYAVDLDPLAVDLCRLSLWIETMNPTLPFGFLDHKIKCGNALIGGWLDHIHHYPVMAWKNRDCGDTKHTNGVHVRQKERTNKQKEFIRSTLTDNMREWTFGKSLFDEDLLPITTAAQHEALDVLSKMHTVAIQDIDERARLYQTQFLGSANWLSVKKALDLWCACWFWPAEKLEHAPLPPSFVRPSKDTRAMVDRIASEMRFFHWELEFPGVFREASWGFDAILGNPPWDIAKPVSKEFFSSIDPLYRSYGKQHALGKQTEYFADEAIEREWLDYNARFRGQSNFMGHASSPFGDPCENEKSQDRFSIFRGRKNAEAHARWREARERQRGFSDPVHPFRHQGSADLNLYKLFLEASHNLIKANGRLGFIVPSGLYSDHGTKALRELFLDKCQWEWLFGIENRSKVFPIDSRYKFNPVIIQKGGTTKTIRTAFMQRDLEDWERAEHHVTTYSREQVERFSPKSLAILEIQSQRDLDILEKIYSNAVLLGDKGPESWGIRYATEFHTTNDSHLFPPRPQWEAKGYRPDEYSRWVLGDWRPIEELWTELGVEPSMPEPVGVELEDWLFDTSAGPERRDTEAKFAYGHLLKPGDVARTDWRVRCAQPPYDRLPVKRVRIPAGVVLSRDASAWIRERDIADQALPTYEGRMISQFDSSQKGWVSGKGRGAIWRKIGWNHGAKRVEPQFLMSSSDYSSAVSNTHQPKVLHMRVGSATNAYTTVGSLNYAVPATDTAACFFTPSMQTTLNLTALVNSTAFDFITKARLVGLHLDFHVFEQNALPKDPCDPSLLGLSELVRRLTMNSPWFSPQTLFSGDDHGLIRDSIGICEAERTRLFIILDAIIAEVYGLNYEDLKAILRDCDQPIDVLKSNGIGRGNPKGFWRRSRDLLPELRQTVLTIVAFRDLASKIKSSGGSSKLGIEAFLAQNQGDGWMIPEALCLKDYGLGHDSRAELMQPIASQLGPRLQDWQLVQDAKESWHECHLHARNLLGIREYQQRIVQLMGLRLSSGASCVDLLRDGFMRRLRGDEWGPTLVEGYKRRVVDYETYWLVVNSLVEFGALQGPAYGVLLEKLHKYEGESGTISRRRDIEELILQWSERRLGDEVLRRQCAEHRVARATDGQSSSGQGNLFELSPIAVGALDGDLKDNDIGGGLFEVSPRGQGDTASASRKTSE